MVSRCGKEGMENKMVACNLEIAIIVAVNANMHNIVMHTQLYKYLMMVPCDDDLSAAIS